MTETERSKLISLGFNPTLLEIQSNFIPLKVKIHCDKINCRNCGAPFENVCKYCGTKY